MSEGLNLMLLCLVTLSIGAMVWIYAFDLSLNEERKVKHIAPHRLLEIGEELAVLYDSLPNRLPEEVRECEYRNRAMKMRFNGLEYVTWGTAILFPGHKERAITWFKVNDVDPIETYVDHGIIALPLLVEIHEDGRSLRVKVTSVKLGPGRLSERTVKIVMVVTSLNISVDGMDLYNRSSRTVFIVLIEIREVRACETG
ncbi:MAG: hypothetical protein J7L11_05570 [Thermoprotei archaeon]|nr:hypothetical protein [Thermoprotei archaeon]